MAAINHLCVVLVLSFTVNFIETYPLCGTMDGSPLPKETDKIYFKDNNHGIRTVEINGTVVACYPDGTLVNNPSDTSASTTGNNENDQPTLPSRIRSGNPPIFLRYSNTIDLNIFFFILTFLQIQEEIIHQTQNVLHQMVDSTQQVNHVQNKIKHIAPNY